MRFVSYAGNAEDVVLWRALGGMGTGFYVDACAAHPDDGSLTRAFYDRGWRGINVAAGADLHRLAAARPRDVTVAPDALAAALDEHAPERIAFLRAAGAPGRLGLQRIRPCVVLAEWSADHDGAMQDLRYRYALFDGISRFYVADEWAAELGPRLSAPANTRDGYVRASDAAGVQREMELQRALARARSLEASAEAAYARAFDQARELAKLHRLVTNQERDLNDIRPRLAHAEAEARQWLARLNASEEQGQALRARVDELQHAVQMLEAVYRSTSWRLTKPLRALSSVARGRGLQVVDTSFTIQQLMPALSAPEPDAAATTDNVPGPPVHHARTPLRTINQFHSGSATGDAVTNSMMLIRDKLRALGYRSDIFVQHLHADLAGDLYHLSELPRRADQLILVHHSMGHDTLAEVLAHPAPKALYFHNITPARFLPPDSGLPAYAELGQRQLHQLRPAVRAAVAASEYNAIALRQAGFDPVWTATVLFDADAMRAAATRGRRAPDQPFTVLFVGRVIESKGQADLIQAFAKFRAALGRPARLVLAGRTDSPGCYLDRIHELVQEHGLGGDVVVTGPLPDAELHAQCAAADLYVSLSHHEGFGVPLVEAMAQGVPVLAWGAGAIPYTLGLADGLLPSRDPADVAAAMLDVATNPARGAALVEAQRAVLDRFALRRQWPALLNALLFAGAAPPPDPQLRRSIAAHLRFAVYGHTEGTYSLAAINRTVAAAIEAERPGRVRLLPVEGRTNHLAPADAAPAGRPAPETGPEVVISQHYPVRVPEEHGDLLLAMVFWEESLLPAATVQSLEDGFAGVLAPSRYVAKVLADSGLSLPVRTVGQAPDLSAYEALAVERRDTPRPSGPFTFLHVSSCFPRKGVDVLLAAYARAFRRKDPVRLVIKGFPNPHNTVPEMVDALQAADPDAPAIEVINRDLPDAALHHLYRHADAVVLPARGEGFNLPAAEAMAAGVPLVVTGHGGHMDFCDASTARLVSFRLARSGSHLQSEYSLWAEPDVGDLAAALQELEGAQRDPAAQAALYARTQRARAQVAERLSRRGMVRRITDASLDLLAHPMPEPIRVGWITSWAVRCGVAEYSRHLLEAMPPHPGVAGHLVLPDDRTEASPAAPLPAHPSWEVANLSSLERLQRTIGAEDPRVIVVQHQPGLMPWDMVTPFLEAVLPTGRLVVVTLHNTRNILDTPPELRARLVAALGRVARLVVHSVPDIHLLQDLGLDGNAVLFPHGVPSHTPALDRRTTNDAPLIGCYGFFLPGKGIGELIEAVSLLRAQVPGARLRLVNADYGVDISANEIERCRDLAAALSMDCAIEWETRLLPDAESLALLEPCDLLVIPTQSSREGSSAAVRTALAAGPPVLVTPLQQFENVGGAVARATGTAPRDIAAGMLAILSDPLAAAGLRQSARDWAADNAWRGVAARFQGMLLGLARQADGENPTFSGPLASKGPAAP